MVEIHLNHTSVLVAAAVNFLLGGLWYSPVLFARPWMQAVGMTDEDVKKGASPMTYVWAFVTSVLTAYGLGCVLSAVRAVTLGDGLLIGAMCAAAFTIPAGIHYAFEARPLKLFILNYGYSTVGLVLMSVVLTMWK
jgi:hypothetical protein